MTMNVKQENDAYEKLRAIVPQELRKEFDAISAGEMLPSFTSDVVFRKLLDPDTHRDRVENLFQLIFGIKDAQVVSSSKTVHTKPSILSKGTAQDVNALLTQRGMLNLEMQVQAQDFIVNRINVYAADMNILQYTVAEGDKKKEFNFVDIGHSYLVVFLKESPPVFKKSPFFIHKKLEITDTNIELERLSTIVYIELDKCLAYVNEHGLAQGQEELCKYLVMIADSNSAVSRELATKDEELRNIQSELQSMSKNREEMFEMLAEKYAEAIKSSELVWARREGERLGKAEGKAIGTTEKEISLIMKKVQKAKSLEVISDELECTPDEIRHLYEVVVECGPGCSVDVVLEKVITKS
ncbi:MAG: PD-(D/E)XK nuclease family transposase [Lachnospiraceae bacterium]